MAPINGLVDIWFSLGLFQPEMNGFVWPVFEGQNRGKGSSPEKGRVEAFDKNGVKTV